MRFDPDDLSNRTTRSAGDFLAANDGGLLDPTWFNSAFWTYLSNRAQMMVLDGQDVYGIAAYDKFITKSYPHDIFTPGKGYRLFAARADAESSDTTGRRRGSSGGKKKSPVLWQTRVGVRARAMVVTDRHLYLAGTPDVVDAQDPWAALDGRKGGVLLVFSKDDGKRLSETRQTSAPIHDGMAAAQGRMYIAQQDGNLVCYE
jgi:hypothetical protein